LAGKEPLPDPADSRRTRRRRRERRPRTDQPFVLRLRAEVAVVETPDGRPALRAPWGVTALQDGGPGVRAALTLLAADGAAANALVGLAAADGGLAVARFSFLLQRWREQAWLSHTLLGPSEPLVTMVPVARGYAPSLEQVRPSLRFRLTRFAYLQQDEGTLVLASPAAPARALFPSRTGVALLAAVAERATVSELAGSLDLPAQAAGRFIGLLLQARLIEAADRHGMPLAPEDVALAQWEFHDLLMHHRSRSDRHGGLYGGTFPFLDTIPPLPAVRLPAAGEPVPLARPDIERLATGDITLTHALERRRSQRTYGDAPITVDQLGEILFRSARVRSVAAADPAHGTPYETSSRPYPSGGRAYEIEIYAAIARCSGLARGLYHYDPRAHALVRLPAGEEHVRALIRDAARAAALASPPQVLLVLSARFQRLSWKYRSIAYAITLKHVGVLYQTMYLVTTAMGLAPCAVGGGSEERFAAATGMDQFVESSVGEFLLGSAPTLA
jgi:oxazoline/thiazoline dehydrogenase